MSQSVDRSTIVSGPGTVTLGSQQMYDKAGIQAVKSTEWNEERVSALGRYDESKADEWIDVSFRPSGRIVQAILDVLFPSAFQTPAIGASVFGGSDGACDIHSTVGKKLTLHNAALIGMPSLKLGAQEPFISGDAMIRGLIKNATSRSASAALYTLANEAWSGSFDRTQVKKLPYTGTWGTGPGTTIVAKESWEIDFDLSLEPRKSDDWGTFDMEYTGLAVRAKCRPNNLSETMWDLQKIQNDAAAAIGSSGRQGKDLVVAADVAGGISATLKDAIWKEGPLAWGETELRAGEIGFESTLDLTTKAVFAIAITT
ncbi:MAG: hypothetical protein HQ559_10710 [Lentisphaerae bacterium]|nr:hypothetical protein [Lentisphaerota bacterium]